MSSQPHCIQPLLVKIKEIDREFYIEAYIILIGVQFYVQSHILVSSVWDKSTDKAINEQHLVVYMLSKDWVLYWKCWTREQPHFNKSNSAKNLIRLGWSLSQTSELLLFSFFEKKFRYVQNQKKKRKNTYLHLLEPKINRRLRSFKREVTFNNVKLCFTGLSN